MRRYEALVVDFGGVLTTPLQDAMASFAAANAIELQDLVRATLAAYSGQDDSLVMDFETGRITEEQFATGFAARLSEYTGKQITPEGIIARLFAALELEETMLAAVEAARTAGLKTALLSNSWGQALYPRQRLDALFDVIVISGEVGLRKPDPAIFTLTTERLGSDPERCVFVDDHPGHLSSARDAGMTTVLHRDPARTISELESLLDAPLS